jgi:hypothetical protein
LKFRDEEVNMFKFCLRGGWCVPGGTSLRRGGGAAEGNKENEEGLHKNYLYFILSHTMIALSYLYFLLGVLGVLGGSNLPVAQVVQFPLLVSPPDVPRPRWE